MTGEEREVERRSKNWCGKEKRGLAEPKKNKHCRQQTSSCSQMTSSENSSSIFLFYTKQENHSYILQNRSSTSDEIYIARNETAFESGFFFFWENWKRLHIRMALVETSFSRKINITHQETSQDTCFLPPIPVRLVF